MVNRGVVTGVTLAHDHSPGDCIGCVLGKSHRTTIPKVRDTRSTKLLQLVHSDVLGPVEVPSLGGARYFVSFIDDDVFQSTANFNANRIGAGIKTQNRG